MDIKNVALVKKVPNNMAALLYIITEGKASNYATIYKNIIFDILTRKYFFAKIITS